MTERTQHIPDVWDAIAGLDDAGREALGALLAEHLPPEVQERHLEAARQTHDLLQPVAGVAAVGLGDIPDSVGLRIVELLTEWACGSGIRTCVHGPHPSRPQPIVSALWRPGLIVCPRCTHMLRLPRGSVEELRCDLCTQIGESIHSDCVVWGALTVLYGACPGCHVARSRPDVG
jgi:LSD1 subclass zinc finger protein